MRTEYKKVKIENLKRYKNNPRNNRGATDKVIESIKECGYISPIIVDENYEIIAGHTRFKALKRLKIEEVPVIICYDLTENQKRKYRLLDNKTNEFASWNEDLLKEELKDLDFDFDFGFNLDLQLNDEDVIIEERDPSCQHSVFENQEHMQFESDSFYGMPKIKKTSTVCNKMLRFCDYKEVENHKDYIAHFYYDDYKFIQAYKKPDKYIDKLKQFKAVVSPDFSVYTDFPRALQILACYRRQWCGAYWNYLGIDVIPDVVWGDEESYDYCFDGIPKKSTVAVSTVGIMNDDMWNGNLEDRFERGYNEMLKRLEPTTILLYGSLVGNLKGNIIRIPSYYEQKYRK